MDIVLLYRFLGLNEPQPATYWNLRAYRESSVKDCGLDTLHQRPEDETKDLIVEGCKMGQGGFIFSVLQTLTPVQFVILIRIKGGEGLVGFLYANR